MKMKNWSKKFLWFILGAITVGFLSFVSTSDAQSKFVKLIMRFGEERTLEDGTRVSISKGEGDFVIVTLSKATSTSSSDTSVKPKTKPDFNSVIGKWKGRWSDVGGSVFSAKMELESFTDTNTIQGAITWKFESSSLSSQEAKIGFTGVEFVRGRYDPETRMLFLEGYRKDDPYEVIGIDKYRLQLSENGGSLTGTTSNNGRWDAKFSLTRE